MSTLTLSLVIFSHEVSLNTSATYFIKCKEWILSSSHGQIELHDFSLCRVRICNATKKLWTIHWVLVVTLAKVGIRVLTLWNSIVTTQGTHSQVTAMPYFIETSIWFFWVGGRNILNKFNKGNFIFADVNQQ